jgi:hypothetical protein
MSNEQAAPETNGVTGELGPHGIGNCWFWVVTGGQRP